MQKIVTNKDRVLKLTKRVVDGAQRARYRYIAWDTELRGFGPRVEPGLKTFIARYCVGGVGGRDRKAIRQNTSGSARRLARLTFAAVAERKDPVGTARRNRRPAITPKSATGAQAAARRIRGREGHSIKPSTLAMDRRGCDSNPRCLIGAKFL
jgi:hypothetical protein